MAIKRYKLQKGPPETAEEKRKARQRQMIDRADKIYFQSARLLLPVGLAMALMIVGAALLQNSLLPKLGNSGLVAWLGTADMVSWLARRGLDAVIFLLEPITTLGFCAVCLKLWRGRKAAAGDLLSFCRKGRWLRSVAFCALYTLAISLPGWLAELIPTAIAMDGGMGSVLSLLGPLGRLVLLVLQAWLSLRLMPAPLLYILNSDEHPSLLLHFREAWDLTDGELTELIGYCLRLLLRVLPIGLVLLVVLLAAIFLPMPSLVSDIIIWAGLGAFIAFAVPLVRLSTIGYMDAWLPTDSQVRKRSAKSED